jgi:hypothetical protein
LLGCHLALRAGRIDQAEAVARDLAGMFPLWSDAHVIVGESALAYGDEARAREAYRMALDCGVPGLASALVRLGDAVRRFGIDHTRVADIESAARARVPGLLWTAYTAARAVEDGADPKR